MLCALSSLILILSMVPGVYAPPEAPEFDAFRGIKRPLRFGCCNFTICQVMDISDKVCRYKDLAESIAQPTQLFKTTLSKS